jgi:hypothetical protein
LTRQRQSHGARCSTARSVRSLGERRVCEQVRDKEKMHILRRVRRFQRAYYIRDDEEIKREVGSNASEKSNVDRAFMYADDCVDREASCTMMSRGASETASSSHTSSPTSPTAASTKSATRAENSFATSGAGQGQRLGVGNDHAIEVDQPSSDVSRTPDKRVNESAATKIVDVVKRSRRAQGLSDHVTDSDALRRIAQILQTGSASLAASQRELEAGNTSTDSTTNETISRRSA